MKQLIILLAILLFTGCKSTPVTYEQISELPDIFPDYIDITLPYNIAPMNFHVADAERVSVLFVGSERYRFNSKSSLITFPEKRWRKMLETEKGNTLDVYITIRQGSRHLGYQGFKWKIAQEPIDKYLSYRLIEPAYEVWNMLQICERDVEGFNVRMLADNNITDRTCMNCHTSNRQENPTTFLHVRGEKGGTIYSKDGKLRKINTKTTETTGVAVYGEIDSQGRYGIFTTADIIPILHSYRTERMEVFDKHSDLILIDFENNTVSDTPTISGEEFQETFPCFSADNRTIYFCRAPSLPQPDSTKHMRYDLYSISFDPETGTLGNAIEKVFDATSAGKSVSFPKCSPDGNYLLFSVSDYGTFPIWHPETDLWMLNLNNKEINKMETTNDRYSDSYHSWSSNSRWIVFASKRDDRVYGRPYFAYVNADGSTDKAFVLPQKDPKSYLTTLKSYNIPELYPYPETYNAHDIRKIYFHKEAEQIEYTKN